MSAACRAALPGRPATSSAPPPAGGCALVMVMDDLTHKNMRLLAFALAVFVYLAARVLLLFDWALFFLLFYDVRVEPQETFWKACWLFVPDLTSAVQVCVCVRVRIWRVAFLQASSSTSRILDNQTVGELKAEVASLKGLLLGRYWTPPTSRLCCSHTQSREHVPSLKCSLHPSVFYSCFLLHLENLLDPVAVSCNKSRVM